MCSGSRQYRHLSPVVPATHFFLLPMDDRPLPCLSAAPMDQDARLRGDSILWWGRPLENGGTGRRDGRAIGEEVVRTDFARFGVCAQQGMARMAGKLGQNKGMQRRESTNRLTSLLQRQGGRSVTSHCAVCCLWSVESLSADMAAYLVRVFKRLKLCVPKGAMIFWSLAS